MPASRLVQGVRTAPGLRGLLFPGFIAGGIVLIGIYFVLPWKVQLVYYQLFAFAALVSVLVGVRLYQPRPVLPWVLFAVMLALTCVADTLNNVYMLVLGWEVPYPAVADWLYIVAYGFLAAAGMAFVRGDGNSARARSATLLDAAILAAGAALPVWVFLTLPNALDTTSTHLQRAVTIAYLSMDLVVLAVLFRIGLGGRTIAAASSLLLGMGALVVSDFVGGVLEINGLYEDGSWIDGGWMLGYVLLGATPLHPSMRSFAVEDAPPGPLTVRRLAALTASVLMIPLVVLFGSASAVSVAIGSALIVGLIVLRLLVEGRRFARFSEEVSAQAQVAERLRHAQKMEALGRLAGGVAHDFNNLLTAIGGYADMLVEQLAGNRELRAEAEEIRRASDRAADLTRQLLAFSRHHVDPELPARIDEVVAETERLLRRLIGERHRLLVALGAPGSVVRVGSTTLEQIVVNLVLNARDAMPDGGTITIETAPVTVGGDAPGVRLRVVDNGHGIDPAIVDRIFEPFFTTKDSSAGTGLGLAIVYAAVDDSGGTIEVESEPGRGTRFEVALPLAVVSATTGAGEPAQATHARAAAARILVAEDEPAIRSLMVSVLRAAGHVVFEAANGQDAIELTATLDRPPDLLVSDVIMPDVGGLVLARVLRERWSRLPILFVSGYTDELLSTADLRSLGAGFLEKPFSAAAFRDEVDRLVGSTVAQPASASSATISS